MSEAVAIPIDAVMIPRELGRGAGAAEILKSIVPLLRVYGSGDWLVTPMPGDLGFFCRRSASENYAFAGGSRHGQPRHEWRDAPEGRGIKLGALIPVEDEG